MIGSKLIVVVCTAFALAIGACKKDDPDRSGAPKEPSATRAAPSDKAPVPPSTGEPRARPAEQMLAAYERARALLAADDTTGLADVAGEIERTAMAVVPATPSGSAEHLRGIASAAKGLGSAGDVDAARSAFGEVSRHVVALLTADPTLAEGKHVFECPMAAGYKKWIQPTAKLENPYMGTKMLSCGGESTWR